MPDVVPMLNRQPQRTPSFRSDQEQTDMLYFQWLIDEYGEDRILTWWKNCVAIKYGHITDPRRI